MKIPCPRCGTEINLNAEIGKLSKGKKKNFSKAERLRRRKRFLLVRNDKGRIEGK